MRAFLAIAILGLLAVSAFADSCSGNCPGGKCPNCPCGTSANRQNAAAWCAKFTGWNQQCCQCIIGRESNGNGNAMNFNSNGSFDVGLWQINSLNWGACGGSAPCDVNANLQCAKKVWEWGGRSFRLWSTSKACGGC